MNSHDFHPLLPSKTQININAAYPPKRNISDMWEQNSLFIHHEGKIVAQCVENKVNILIQGNTVGRMPVHPLATCSGVFCSNLYKFIHYLFSPCLCCCKGYQIESDGEIELITINSIIVE